MVVLQGLLQPREGGRRQTDRQRGGDLRARRTGARPRERVCDIFLGRTGPGRQTAPDSLGEFPRKPHLNKALRSRVRAA